jgi:hypothetical protein
LRVSAALVISAMLSLGGCATSNEWRRAAMGTAALDVATTAQILSQGGRELNPVYGRSASTGTIAAVNAALFAAVWWISRDWPEEKQKSLWRAVTVMRALPVAWNAAQLADR